VCVPSTVLANWQPSEVILVVSGVWVYEWHSYVQPVVAGVNIVACISIYLFNYLIILHL
jgi:hypothetical protein